MADNNNETTAVEKYSALNPKNLINGLSRLIGADVADDDSGKTNHQGELLWTTLVGYVVGNSLGTANTNAGRKRLNLGPVYIW